MNLLVMLFALAAPQAPSVSENSAPPHPKITIVRPAADAKMTGPTKLTGPKIVEFSARIEVKGDQWTPAALMFEVTDARVEKMQYGSRAQYVDRQQCDGRQLLKDEIKFVHLPPGKYRVKVIAFGAEGQRCEKGQFLFVQE